MDTLLQGTPNTGAYHDDILIQGSNFQMCSETVTLVLQRLNDQNVRIQPNKCRWFKRSVECLGHVISEQGRAPSPSHSGDAPVPINVKELRSFLGLINFYSNFLPSAITLLKPLRSLTGKSKPFVWSNECQTAFTAAKQLLLSSSLLIHLDPAKKIVVHTDSLPVGVASVLNHEVSHMDNTVVGKPVLFASCSLTQVQQKYSQLDREAFAIIFVVTKLRKYLWGRRFTLVTDNQPIRHIFSPEKIDPNSCLLSPTTLGGSFICIFL